MYKIINGELYYLGFQGNSFKNISKEFLEFILTKNYQSNKQLKK